MTWRDSMAPIRMSRVAIVAPTARLRGVLVAVAAAGVVQLERSTALTRGAAGEAVERARQRLRASASPLETVPAAYLTEGEPDLAELEASGDLGRLLGEVELEQVDASAKTHGDVTALAGWIPTSSLAALTERLGQLDGAVVKLTTPQGSEPPTLVRAGGTTKAFQPLVDTYATLPYADLDPAALAGVAYVVMFGMMFGDVGHGALLLIAGLGLASRRPKALARFHNFAPFVIGAGAASCLFGLAFGEMFGPTHLVPTLWMAPLDHPTSLLAVAVAAGAGLLTIAYSFGSVNRWREGGAARALVATSGIAGTALYLGLALAGLGWYRHLSVVLVLGAALALLGAILGFVGYYAETTGRFGGAAQAGIEIFDSILRIGTNTVSFARLAAFGLTHAALCGLVWSATSGLWHRGPGWWLVAVAVFIIGNAIAFALEGLVAGIQALRLEYYELFSRILVSEGRRFQPWHVPVLSAKEP